MKRLKKIRGQRRLKRKIENWRTDYLQPNIDFIMKNHYDYVKVWVSPFNNLRYKERNYTGPKSINRDLILNSLLDIYEAWDLQLKQLNIPYYLKIWFYEPRITSSQIVCGIEDRIMHYADIFSLATTKMQFPHDRYKALQNRTNMFNWTPALDEEIVENDYWPKERYQKESDYLADQKLYQKLEQKQIRKEDLSNQNEKLIRYYVPKGNVWIGSKK